MAVILVSGRSVTVTLVPLWAVTNSVCPCSASMVPRRCSGACPKAGAASRQATAKTGHRVFPMVMANLLGYGRRVAHPPDVATAGPLR
jgi:hypothetical protein